MKEAGKPLPQFSTDDVVDYMVTEAVVAKMAELKEKQRKEAERENWRKSHKKLAKGRG